MKEGSLVQILSKPSATAWGVSSNISDVSSLYAPLPLEGATAFWHAMHVHMFQLRPTQATG